VLSKLPLVMLAFGGRADIAASQRIVRQPPHRMSAFKDKADVERARLNVRF